MTALEKQIALVRHAHSELISDPRHRRHLLVCKKCRAMAFGTLFLAGEIEKKHLQKSKLSKMRNWWRQLLRSSLVR